MKKNIRVSISDQTARVANFACSLGLGVQFQDHGSGGARGNAPVILKTCDVQNRGQSTPRRDDTSRCAASLNHSTATAIFNPFS